MWSGVSLNEFTWFVAEGNALTSAWITTSHAGTNPLHASPSAVSPWSVVMLALSGHSWMICCTKSTGGLRKQITCRSVASLLRRCQQCHIFVRKLSEMLTYIIPPRTDGPFCESIQRRCKCVYPKTSSSLSSSKAFKSTFLWYVIISSRCIPFQTRDYALRLLLGTSWCRAVPQWPPIRCNGIICDIRI